MGIDSIARNDDVESGLTGAASITVVVVGEAIGGTEGAETGGVAADAMSAEGLVSGETSVPVPTTPDDDADETDKVFGFTAGSETGAIVVAWAADSTAAVFGGTAAADSRGALAVDDAFAVVGMIEAVASLCAVAECAATATAVAVARANATCFSGVRCLRAVQR